MNEKLKFYLRASTGLSGGLLDDFASHFKLVEVKRGTIILRAGEVCKHFYFVSEGCIRVYYLTKQGHEKTRFIAIENMVATSLSGFISGGPSFEFVETVENSRLYAITRNKFYESTDKLPQWRSYYLSLLESAYLYQNKMIENRSTLSSKQRYEALIKENPLFVRRLSNKILASYLDVTQETLSRLKSG